MDKKLQEILNNGYTVSKFNVKSPRGDIEVFRDLKWNEQLEADLEKYFDKKQFGEHWYIKFPNLSFNDMKFLSKDNNIEYVKVFNEFDKLGFKPEEVKTLIKVFLRKDLG